MRKWFTRKNVLLCSLVLLVAVAGYLNVLISRDETASVPGTDVQVAAKPTAVPKASSGAKAAATATTTSAPAPTVKAGETYFSDARAEREEVRKQEIAWIDEMLAAKETSSQARREAEQMKLSLLKWMDIEQTCADVLRAKGFEDALVTMRDGSVNVVVKAKGVTDADAVRIMELCMRETGEKADNIKIMAAK